MHEPHRHRLRCEGLRRTRPQLAEEILAISPYSAHCAKRTNSGSRMSPCPLGNFVPWPWAYCLASSVLAHILHNSTLLRSFGVILSSSAGTPNACHCVEEEHTRASYNPRGLLNTDAPGHCRPRLLSRERWLLRQWCTSGEACMWTRSSGPSRTR
ncbi:hypothetical protein K466DRAFT_370488 [Polyporus arcularius HHB13444]|uniref:Uncharacterized protein n=1 Tax=Polyporus arcularius HHB13444 TaxID=1314778 RepID=A0A5C3PMB7_9APHY|nr:hypothetical protein K466DRAFT_370488 [Polyporus arcularius HHB13444]